MPEDIREFPGMPLYLQDPGSKAASAEIEACGDATAYSASLEGRQLCVVLIEKYPREPAPEDKATLPEWLRALKHTYRIRREDTGAIIADGILDAETASMLTETLLCGVSWGYEMRELELSANNDG